MMVMKHRYFINDKNTVLSYLGKARDIGIDILSL